MGFVFLIPFLFFLFTGKLSKVLVRDLLIVIVLTIFVASLGWIMVASGLHDRPWVNAYKLTIHLSLGITLFSYLLWITLKIVQPITHSFPQNGVDKWLWPLNIVLGLQLILGGIMSGARTAIVYPEWPLMKGEFVPAVIQDAKMWTVENMVEYEQSFFQPALIQFLHRITAYALIFIVLAYLYQAFTKLRSPLLVKTNILLIIMLITQAVLGIITVMNSIGQVPVGLGVAHQFGAIALVGIVIYLNYLFRPGRLLVSVDKTVEKVD